MSRVFGYHIPRSLAVLGAAEIAILFASAHIGVAFQLYNFGMAPAGGQPLWMRAVFFCALMLVVMTALGLYHRDYRDREHVVLIKVSVSFCFAFIAMPVLHTVLPNVGLGASAFVIALVCAGVGILSCRLIYFHDMEKIARRRVLVLGVGERARSIEALRRKADRRGVHIVGFIDVEQSSRLIRANRILRVGGSITDYARRCQIDEIVVALDDRRKKLPLNQMLQCKVSGIRVMEVGEFVERQVGKIRLDSLNPSDLVFCNGFSAIAITSTAKRVFDLTVSLVILILVLPFKLCTALAILIESKGMGPIIYRQVRVGKNGQHFEVFKFRSMRVDAESDGVARWAKPADERVTAVGAFIRKTRIDELPQLVNVLRGDMSFVGPRPERPQFVQELEEKIPYYGMRHSVKPGITGWAQICYPYGDSEEDAKEKLQYDLYYLKNYSLFLDLVILVQTVQAILWGKGR